MSDSTLRQRGTTAAASASATPAAGVKPPLVRAVSSHSHHSHSHSHGDEEAEALLAALKGGNDPGSRVTLIGLGSNVGLTVVKGSAGYILGSAALLADAAHSGSDLLADIVTLTTYRMSRKPVSATHPYGYGKYESLGSLVVSFLLIGTALGIGLHSYHLLLTTLAHMPNMNAALLASLDFLPHGHSHGGAGDDHGHDEGDTDARAMLFAGASVIVKEWLYRITLKVAKAEHSNVLLANALHHRSDAFGSLVALGAIGGAWAGFPVLDPLGGLLVSGMILKNGAGVGVTALKELVATPLPSTASLPILAIPSIRIFSSGPSFLVDVQLVLPSNLTLKEANEVEETVTGKGRFLRLAGIAAALVLVAAAWRSHTSGERKTPTNVLDTITDPTESEWDVSLDQEVPPSKAGGRPPVDLEDLAAERPASLPVDSGYRPDERTATYDLEHCKVEGAEPCRFLLPGWIGGQETRGQEHLYRLGLMALALDRILVLPNASHSELGACLERPFTFYYHQASLAEFGISTVTQMEFTAWLESQTHPLTGQRVVLERRGDSTFTDPVPDPVVEIGGKLEFTTKEKGQTSCMSKLAIDYSKFDNLVFSGRFADTQLAGTAFVETFIQHLRAVTGSIPTNPPSLEFPPSPSVISIPIIVPWWTTTAGRLGVDLSVIRYQNPTALQPTKEFTHLEYAPAWTEATQVITEKLKPFVAIHWRTERVNVRNFAPCTAALVTTLTELKRDYPDLTTVYLLTDYPMESLRGHEGEVKPHSASYGRIPKEASRSMQEFLNWIEGDQSGLRLTTWTQEEEEIEFGDVTRELLPIGVRLKDLDLSLVGMVDKDVAMKAQIFVAGSQAECGKRSSYTASVITQRQAAREAGGKELWNDVVFFKLPPKKSSIKPPPSPPGA
ncbi:hypothetical protein RQP46_008521 [Phenoliferia psychrophenolica]